MSPVKEDRVYKYGERGSGTTTRSGTPQDYAEILRQCLAAGKLFQDPEFPCNFASYGAKINPVTLSWLRPKELVGHPKFFVDGISRDDVNQGNIGNCWFVASLATLTQRKSLFERVVPSGQTFDEESYAGVFHFRFWRCNRWIDVVVDDRLPVIDGELASIKSNKLKEFWSALAEKAYAKLHGSYAALEGGTGTEALVDLTGGLPEQILLDPPPKNTFRIIKRAFERKSLLTCSFVSTGKADVTDARETLVDDGLYASHEYSVTGAVEFKLGEETIQLLRLRNPWGSSEWTGPWSDSSEEWKRLSEKQRKDLGLTVRDDGEFWMPASAFLKRFEMVDMCHLKPGVQSEEDLEEDVDRKVWEVCTFEGSWVPGVSAGGPPPNESFAANPQYLLTLKEPDCDDEECSVIISLMQKTRRVNTTFDEGQDGRWFPITTMVFEVDDPESRPKPLPFEYLSDNTDVGTVPLSHAREITKRLRLLPGTYCLMPCTDEEGRAGDFLLRIFTEQKSHCTECDENVCPAKPEKPSDEADKAKPEDEAEDEVPSDIRVLFRKVAGDEPEIEARSLQKLFNCIFQRDGKTLEFPLELCRSMMALMDADYTGGLDVTEFYKLFKYVVSWEEAFKQCEKDSCGYLNTYQLRKALRLAGYGVNLHVLVGLVLRYGDRRKISLVDFLACAVKVRCMREVFDQHAQEDRTVTFTLNEWMKVTMYC